jgi:hypothetical protein
VLKLLEVKSGYETNWHSILEQTYGFINGIGVGMAALYLASRAPALMDQFDLRRWTRSGATFFVLMVVTYLNLSKNPADWVKAKTVPPLLYGISALGWFNLAYLALALATLVLLAIHRRRRIELIPVSPAGKLQLLLLIFLWWMVVGNFERALVSFAPQRLVTEGVIFLNAIFLSFLVLTWRSNGTRAVGSGGGWWFGTRAVVGVTTAVAVAALTIVADWALVRAVYGNQFAGHAALHIRFGPNATATKAKPRADQPHP